jgi:hypothetical protein
MTEMNAQQSSSNRSAFRALTGNWFRRDSSRMKLVIRWAAVLFCALFWLGMLALIV